MSGFEWFTKNPSSNHLADSDVSLARGHAFRNVDGMCGSPSFESPGMMIDNALNRSFGLSPILGATTIIVTMAHGKGGPVLTAKRMDNWHFHRTTTD